MKLVIAFIFISFGLFSQEITSSYIFPIKKKTTTYVLHLRDSNKYEVVDFIKSGDVYVLTSKVDTGSYLIKKKFGIKTITFTSVRKKNFTLNKKTYLIYKGKFYEKPLDIYYDKYKASLTLDTAYKKTIPFDIILKNNNIKTEYVKTFFFTNVKKYSPIYLTLITDSYCGPGCYKRIGSNGWNGDTTYKSLINDYSTMIHETTHQYNTDGYDWDKGGWTYRILVEPDITIKYVGTKTFKSELFIGLVPKEAPKKIFRYDLYVDKGAFPSANTCGIYGLMDEFSAYRNGTKSSIEATKNAIKLGDGEKITLFQSLACGEYFAYYEFRLFIAWYLEWAKKNYKDVYKGIIENTNLRITFTLIDEGFKNDIKELEGIIKKYPYYGYDYFEENNVKYLRELLVNHEKTLQDFKIKGVTKENYKTFLK